jgi:hypothetical protein
VKRFLTDTDFINRVIDNPGALERIVAAARSSASTMIGNHVGRDQLDATKDPIRREKLLHAYDSLLRVDVPTWGAVFDVSRFDQCGLGDGSESGVSI